MGPSISKTPSLFDALPSKLDELPEEMLVNILENCAQVERAEPRPTQGAYSYSDLLTSCQLNRKCSRAGQEVLFRHCDSTSNQLTQPYLLLRTLLTSPKKVDLGRKAPSLILRLPREEIPSRGHRSPPQWTMRTSGSFWDEEKSFKVDIRDRACWVMVEHIRKTPLPADVKHTWINGVLDCRAVFWYLTLISLVPNIRRLEVRNLFARGSATALIHGLRAMGAAGLLESLSTVVLRGAFETKQVYYDVPGGKAIKNLSWELEVLPLDLRLPFLKALDVAPE